MSIERWLPVVGYEGMYEVSDLGRVRALERPFYGSSTRMTKARVLKQAVKPGTGYLSVHLTSMGKTKIKNVHRLVSDAFIGPRPEDMDTCHCDGDKTNNAASNLRYDSKSANMTDAVRHGTHFESQVKRCPRGHEYSPDNTRRCFFQGGWHRRCRTCERAQDAARRIRARELRAA